MTEHVDPWPDPDPDFAGHEEQPDAARAWPDADWLDPDRRGPFTDDDADRHEPDPDGPDADDQDAIGPGGTRQPPWEASGPGEHPDQHGDSPGYAPDGDAGPPPDTAGPGMGHVGADPDAIEAAGPADGFPPLLHVGALPEPVDGFPWIDADTLGPDPGAAAPVGAGGPDDLAASGDPADLAAYAGESVPAGADPWQHLAASDDPATAALARFWRPPS